MYSRGWRQLVLVGALAFCTGCSSQRARVSRAPVAAPEEHRIPEIAFNAPQAVAPVAGRQSADERRELQRAALFVDVEDGAPPAAPPAPSNENNNRRSDAGIPVTEYDCMCRAANSSPEVAIVLLELQLPSTPNCKKQPTPDEVLRYRLLQLRAAEAANLAAGRALQAFYGLAEARRQRELVDASLARLDEALADLESIRDRGIAAEVDQHQLALQRSQLQRRRTEVETAIVSANSTLKLLLGEWPASDAEYDPQVEPPAFPAFDRAQSAGTAISQRPDLNAARLVLSSMSRNSSTTVVGMLQQTYPGSTIPVPGGGCALSSLLAIHDGDQVLSVRRRQADRLLNAMKRSAVDEVVRYGREASNHLEEMALAERDVSRTDQKIADLQDLRASGRSTYFDVVRVELQRIESESEVVRHRFAAETAFAKLRQAEGALAVECGWIEQCAPITRRGAAELQEPIPLMPASYEQPAGTSLTIKQGMAKCFLK
ncbi:MAG: TolC family protein [Planctomycetota bacterium]|nr:MAG: TolC family protein [Planctomycetota bacterium]REK19970.1 MAG: TolC family protein [Planctomycetota bacterium]